MPIGGGYGLNYGGGGGTTGGGGTNWNPWMMLGGGALQGLGNMFSSLFGSEQAQGAKQTSEIGKAWTQLLGLSQIEGAEGQIHEGLKKFLETMSKLPGVAEAGEKAQLGQLAGAESGAINQVTKNIQKMQGGVGQSAASKGFYGSSVHGGMSNQAIESGNQSIADIMSGFAGQKAGVIGQGTQNKMAGLSALGGAQATATNAYHKLLQDKLGTILATANAWGAESHGGQKILEMLGKSGLGGGKFAEMFGPSMQQFQVGGQYGPGAKPPANFGMNVINPWQALFGGK